MERLSARARSGLWLGREIRAVRRGCGCGSLECGSLECGFLEERAVGAADASAAGRGGGHGDRERRGDKEDPRDEEIPRGAIAAPAGAVGTVIGVRGRDHVGKVAECPASVRGGREVGWRTRVADSCGGFA